MSHSPATASAETAPLPLRTRLDLEWAEVEFAGQPSIVCKDPVGLKYVRLLPIQREALRLLEFPATLDSLEEQLNQFAPTLTLERRDIMRMLADLHERGLIYSVRSGQGEQLLQAQLKQQRSRWKSLPQMLLFCKFPGWAPGRFLDRLQPVARVIFHPVIMATMGILIVVASMLVIREQTTFQQRLPDLQQFFTWQNLPYLWLSIVITKVIHELGHALACRRCGAEPEQIGIMLLMFAPTLYCDVTDSWMLKSKWKRIAIGLAGPFFEWVLAAVALFGWWWTEPGTLHYVCMNIFVLSAVTTTIFNLNPLVKFDGYYILSDWLEIPNLRQQADRAVQAAFCRHILRTELPARPFEPELQSSWLIVYSLSAWAYRWTILAGITVLLYITLKPAGLERFAFLVATGSALAMLWQIVSGIRYSLREVRPLTPSLIRTGIAGLTFAIASACLFLVPVPYWIVCECELQPRDIQHLHNLVAGQLKQVHVIPGETVAAGQLLVTLDNPELQDERRDLLKQREQLQTRIRVAQIQQDSEALALTRDQLDSVNQHLLHIDAELQLLQINAPCAGRIIPAERSNYSRPEQQQRLGSWYGTIFDAGVKNAWLAAGTTLLSVAPSEEMEAIVLIEQHVRNDVTASHPILLQCDVWPGRVLHSRLTHISTREMLPYRTSPSALDTTNRQDASHTNHAPYLGVAALPDLTTTALPALGSGGLARITVTHRSVAEWGWRFLCRTFRFRL